MNVSKRRHTIIYDIFGYSVIGIIAFAFGIFLQNYNSKNDLFNQLHSALSPSLILLFVFHILFICLFGFSYAVVIFHRSKQGLKQSNQALEEYRQEVLYNNVGKWIEIIIVVLFISVGVIWVFDHSIVSRHFWGYLLCSGLIFFFPPFITGLKQ